MSAFNETSGIISAADFLPTDRTRSVSGDIQRLIDENPNRTIYFPDGVYLLDKPILTPADPKKSVSLALSDFAIFRAAENWNSDGALVRLGGKEPANDIRTCGSNYSFSGGIVDGCMKADGISIDGGRETVVRNVSIKHTKDRAAHKARRKQRLVRLRHLGREHNRQSHCRFDRSPS